MLESAEPRLWAMMFAILAGLIGLRYLAFAGGALALTLLYARRLEPRRIQTKPVLGVQLRREALYSFSTIFIFSAVFVAALAINRQWNVLQIYFSFEEYGLLWWGVSIIAGLAIHDFYFYWAHRFMHFPGVFERVHRVHHLSTNPSPLAAFAFHPLEAVIESLVVLVIAAILPIHPSALLIIGMYSLMTNVIGHLGYELFPASWANHPVLRFLNTATSHNQHHATFHYNFGLYSLVWDHIFGTIHPKYVDVYRAVTGTEKPEPLLETLP